MQLRSLFLYLIFALTFGSCGDRKATPPPIDPAFTNYISGFTAGVISNQSTIRIRLVENSLKAKVGEEVEEDYFDFSPNIEGTAVWISNRIIEFRPAEQLPSGKIYDAEFELGELLDVPDHLATFEFRFQIIKQHLYVDFESMQAHDDAELRWQQLTGALQTNDYADPEAIEQTLTAAQNGKALRISWEFSPESRVHRFRVDSVQRGEEAGQVVLAWDGAAIEAETTGEEVVKIPPLGDFQLMNVSMTQLPEQKVTLHFSDPLDAYQSLDGLIYFKEGDALRLQRSRNKVEIYPQNPIVGNRSLVVQSSIKNSVGYALKEGAERQITFSSMKPEVAFLKGGNIVPSTNGFKIPIKAVNLNAVNVKVQKIFEENVAQFFQVNQYGGNSEFKRVGRVVLKESIPLVSEQQINYSTWNNFHLDLSDMIRTEPGAIYRISLSFDRSQSLYPCEDNADEEEEGNTQSFKITSEEEAWYDEPGNYYWEYEDYRDSRSGRYNWRDRENPCKDSYYMRNQRTVSKNVIASNIGIIAKRGDDRRLKVAVTDLRTTEPIKSADLEVYNFQNQLLETVRTNGDGMADIALSNNPYLMVAKRDKEYGYLRLDDGSALSMSMFDIGGAKNAKGVKGFIYGERGVWRPGDSLYLSFILEDKNQTIPDNHPVVMELYTPEGQLYGRKVTTKGINGFYDLRTATDQDAPTGNWLAKVKVGNSKFSKSLKIETIKPNRLKIELEFEEDVMKKDQQDAKLISRWLHGADASGLGARIDMNLSASRTSFKDYSGYKFDDPVRSFYTEEKTVFDGKLDDYGKADFNPAIQVGENAPGMLKAFFKTRVFERGGDFSIDRFSIMYSPFSSYVGVKVPKGKGWNGALFSNETNQIPIVTVDEDGNPVDREQVKIEIYDVSWRWWWERGTYDDLSRYVNNKHRHLIKTDYVDTKNGKAIYEMTFDEHRWGRKLIRITDPVSNHIAGTTFYMTYRGWWNQSSAEMPGGAEMLNFSVEKERYEVGEKIKLQLPKFEEGRVLVSLESGSKVIKTFWKEADELEDGIEFEATEEMAPNVYAHLSLIQPHATTANDLPIRMYGIQNIPVESPNTHLAPKIEMPDELAPEQEVKIRVSEENGKAMTYTIAVVDDGLLDLTRFRTPDPWPHFYKREALGVKTWDLYRYVMGAFSGQFSGLLALGGDEASGKGKGKKANRFEPVVRFLGPFELKKGKKAEHIISMPNYVGSVRTMVVAGQDGAYGATDKTTPVKKPLMVLTTLPRVVSPNETVKVPVTVFAMDKKVKNVKVKLEANELFEVVGEKTQSITFNKPGDQIVFFELKVKQGIGIGKVNVNVSGAGEKASHAIELDVRAPNPEIKKYEANIIEGQQTWNTTYELFGIDGTNKAVVEVSSFPSLNLESRLRYLIQYPHGCIEQTTSSVFPQVHLSKLVDLSPNQLSQIQSNISEGLNRLRSFQTSEGGFAYWPGREYSDEWGTNYAGHFMIEAKLKGYALPTGMFDAWVKYQRQKANAWQLAADNNPRRAYYSNQLDQAYRLYTLALAGKPTLGAMNRFREMENLSVQSIWRLAAAYHLAGQAEVAKQLIKELTIEVPAYRELSGTYGSDLRDKAMILETLTLFKDRKKGMRLLRDIAKYMGSDGWYSTQTTAYCLLACARFIGDDEQTNNMQFSLSQNGKKQEFNINKGIKQISLDTDQLNGQVSLMNKGNSPLFVQLQYSGIPLDDPQLDKQENLALEVIYMNMDGSRLDPSRLEQGTDFMVQVGVTNVGGVGQYDELALTHLFPSGWEIRNLRMDEVDSGFERSTPDYQDIRDDRVFTYFDLYDREKKSFRILLNAAYLGEFYLPAIECSAMYDNSISALKKGQWVKVVPAGQ